MGNVDHACNTEEHVLPFLSGEYFSFICLLSLEYSAGRRCPKCNYCTQQRGSAGTAGKQDAVRGCGSSAAT